MEKIQKVIAKGLSLPISTKAAIEICKFIKNKTPTKAKRQLDLVIQKRIAIPMTRYNQNRGHRKGKIGPGFYPQKASREIIRLLNSVEANARNKGLNTEQLIVKKVIVNKASSPMKTGRIKGQTKRTHIEIEAHELNTSQEIKKLHKPKEKESSHRK